LVVSTASLLVASPTLESSPPLIKMDADHPNDPIVFLVPFIPLFSFVQ
jgi:hypothetical protein